MTGLTRLPAGDLALVLAALRSGRLTSPYADVALLHCFPQSDPAATGRALAGLDRAGWSAGQIAGLIEAVVAERRAAAPDREVELVWTGPEVAGSVNRDTGVVVRELFGRATADVLIAGFAVYKGKEIFRRLADRMAEVPALSVRLFLDIRRKESDSSPTRNVLARFARRFCENDWPGGRLPAIFYDPRSLQDGLADQSARLHAKCVVVDRSVSFVTSANFTEAAQLRNIEVGTLVHSRSFSYQLVEHFERLVETGHLVALRLPA